MILRPNDMTARTLGKLRRMQAQYLGIVALVGIAALIAGVLSAISWILGPKKNTKYKSAPYECGVAPMGDAHERFPIKFYLVAIVFILFDIEVVFLWSWMTVYKNADTQFMVFSFFEFLTYMATWIIGYLYAIKVGAIDWDETTSLAPEKLAIPKAGSLRSASEPLSPLVTEQIVPGAAI